MLSHKVHLRKMELKFGKLKELSRVRLQTILLHTRELIDKYRMILLRTNKRQVRLLNYRVKKLEQVLDLYVKRLDKLDAQAPIHKKKKKMTEQAKMKIKRSYSLREDFLYRQRNKLYAKKVSHGLVRN